MESGSKPPPAASPFAAENLPIEDSTRLEIHYKLNVTFGREIFAVEFVPRLFLLRKWNLQQIIRNYNLPHKV